MSFCGDKEAIVSFVNGATSRLKPGFALTMTIRREKFEGSCVYTVIAAYSDDYGDPKAQPFLPERVCICNKAPAG